ncbi:MAG: glycerol-3-phosphate 1-O-acyltransferase PlsY [Clostridiales Family XIII bacterium]|jgi:glycerol-3-phosphate acyltransferase PlsY|nr:glycerol-3-phosphate 1-O-acyltransferase PlsY [Clostridiales Family XIII bacterium]
MSIQNYNFITGLAGGDLAPVVVILAAAAAYFIGNINPAIILGKIYGVDVRKSGSGNAGTTNALRSIGKRAGAITFVVDVLKGFLCFFIPAFFSLPLAMLCGLFVIVGHMYPVIFRFHGGKGVATAFGVLLAANWVYALILIGVVFIMVAIARRVSLGVIVAVIVAVVLAFTGFLGNNYYPLWIFIIVLLILWKHRANIARLLKGTEPKLSIGKKDVK